MSGELGACHVSEKYEELLAGISSQLNTITASSNDIIETQTYSELNIDVPASNLTQSPSAAPKTYDPFTSYTENAVTPEMKLKLTDLVERLSENFEQVGESRKVYYTGEFEYFYTGKYHPPTETPFEIQELLDMVRPNLSDPKSWINYCLITRYDDGVSSIPLHSNDETFIDPKSEILTVLIVI